MISLRKLITAVCLLVLFIQITLAPHQIVSAQSPVTGEGDQRQVAAQNMQAQSFAVTQANDTHFVADTGGDLDQYLFRTDRPDGLIKFNIPITRYFFIPNDSKIVFENGFLRSDSVTYAINKKILPATLRLRLSVYDVDEDATWCPERDEISINGKPLYENGRRAILTGANDTWSTKSVNVPIGMIKFPQQKGNDLNKPSPAYNEIAIRVDAGNCTSSGGSPAWAVQVDYGVLEMDSSPVRPVLFVHGWTGTTSTFNTIENRLRSEGIQSAGQPDLLQGIYPISNTAGWLTGHIYKAALEYGVDKINLFAHSKGGLFSRYAMNASYLASKVDRLVTFDTPHHGTFWADDSGAMRVTCAVKYPTNLASASLCYEATKELTQDYVRMNFNYQGCTYNIFTGWKNCTPAYKRYSSVGYTAFGANEPFWELDIVSPDASAGFPWNDDRIPMPSTLRYGDVLYNTTHGGILELNETYQCAVHRLDGSRYSCPSSSNSMLAPAAPLAVTADQPIYRYDGSTNAAGLFSASANVTNSTQLLVEVYSPTQSTFTLTKPGGQVITPTVANSDPSMAYSTDTDQGPYHYVYVINAPAAGVWSFNLQSTGGVAFSMQALVASPVTLQLAADRETYQPGEMITMQAALLQSGSTLKGGTVTGTLEQPGGSNILVSFRDDGNFADSAANDGIFTGQAIAPDTQAHLFFTVSASQGANQRKESLLIAVSKPTALISFAGMDWISDDDSDGFWDSVDVEVGINVLQSGHFDLSGTLVDSSGAVVATAAFHSRDFYPAGLEAGMRIEVLRFDGREIYNAGKNGPYTLTGLRLQDTTGHIFQVSALDDARTTFGYVYTDFEHDLLRMESATVSATDSNQNGRIDALVFHLKVGADVPGGYEVTGRLLAQNGEEVGWEAAQFVTSAPGLHTVDLSFSGAQIGRLQLNGPFTLTDVNLARLDGTQAVYFSRLFTTDAYKFNQFEEGYYHHYLTTVMRGLQGSMTPPVLSGPGNGAQLTTLIPTFAWSMGSQPSGSVGCLTFGTSPNPTGCQLSFGAGYSGQWSYTMWYNLTPNTRYYWRVGVMPQGSNNVAAWSEERSFITGAPNGQILAAPALNSPANNSIVPVSGVTLVWTAVSGAVEYNVSVKDKIRSYWYGFTVSSTQLELDTSFLEDDTSYEWDVTARNEYAWGVKSLTRSFSTSLSPQTSPAGLEPPAYQMDAAGNRLSLEP